MDSFDFSGWATKANLRCSDGRVIMKDAFKQNDGETVPLVWSHNHTDVRQVLGHALLENRDEGVYAYGSFNDTDYGQIAKKLVQHGDVKAMSIHANQLKQQNSNVMHGNIIEVSLVLAGANPGASVESVLMHEDGSDDIVRIFTGEDLILNHADDAKSESTDKTEDKTDDKTDDKTEKSIDDVLKTFNKDQLDVLYYFVGAAKDMSDDKNDDENNDKKGDEDMKHNVFEKDEDTKETTLSHSDQSTIINMAKSSSVGSLQNAIELYAEQNELSHGIDDIESLFPEYKDVRPGAPELIQRDQGWVTRVMQKVHKSPISRIRTRQADARGEDLRAFGYQKGKMKKEPGNIKLLKRTTDPQTVYRKDSLHRDDIIDITDFDVVEYQYGIMKQNLYEEIATAIMISDGRDVGDEMKISEEHIRPIWGDDELYTIYAVVDFEEEKKKLQGTNTGANFGDNYVYAEAIIENALYAREKYKGSGNVDFYCTPHLLNVMLLARDLNGRRIYNSKSELVSALNVNDIITVEQFEGKTRTDSEMHTRKLLGIFVNLADYQVGSTKGGEITRFNQFDIDFNQEKYLIETRLSGALTRIYSAVVLEEKQGE